MGDDIVELHKENESLRNKIGSYDEKWLEEFKTRMLKQIDDEKRANLLMLRMKKQMKKHQIKRNILIPIQIKLYKWLIYLIMNYGNQTLMV